MKHQYFGDINDFLKFSLLQSLCGGERLSLGVCWMLTPDDGSTDGSLTRYLNEVDRWRKYNPVLFDRLSNGVFAESSRSVLFLEASNLLPRAEFHSNYLTDDLVDQLFYFSAVQRKFAKMDLLFFDPDNGLENQLRPYRCEKSIEIFVL